MTIYYITIATKPHPVLDKIKHRVQQNGETIEVLGLQENREIGWENQQRFGVKLREVADYLRRPHLAADDLVLFTDAYDVGYFGTLDAVVERYRQFDKPIVFGCETECHPDPGRASQYSAMDRACEFPYLNSGLFVGTVAALRQCISRYQYNDTDDDQRYWTTQYFEHPELIALDHTNTLFLNTSGYSANWFMYDYSAGLALYKAASPIFVHVNGPDKTFVKQLVNL